jgi:hypothetical protein
MKRRKSTGAFLLLLSFVTLVLVASLGAMVIGPDLSFLQSLSSKQDAPDVLTKQEIVWEMPPTWTPAKVLEPTPTVTPISLIVTLSWPTAPAWDTPIVPQTPLAAQVDLKPVLIGLSVQNRPLEVYRFGQGPFQRMILAGIHGGYEWNTIALADELIAFLQKHPEIVPSHITLYILRSLNPDGEAAGNNRFGHNNANGVDLNRNWDANWRSSWPSYGCYRKGPVSAGPHPGSEPETQALMAFLVEHSIDALVSYHSAAPGIYASGDPPDPESEKLAEYLAEASGYAYPGPATGCIYTGSLVDWAYQSLGIAAVDVELRNHEETDFEKNLHLLMAMLNWIP